MLPYFWYLLKVIICSGILLGYYWLFLRNKIFHQYNRFYLLMAMGLSLLLPLLKINFWQQHTETNGAILVLRAVSVGDEYMNSVVISAQKSFWNFQNLYPLLYWLVSLVFVFVLLRTLYIIRTLLKNYPVQQVEEVTFVNTNDDSTPFSFFKYIFWNSSIDMNTVTGRQIFKHEVAHIQEKHTYDKLFVNISLIFFWCNPFFWLYRKELNMIHEFIADKKAVEDSDTAAFAAMILQSAYPRHRFELTNNFFYSPIKRRLRMLTKIDNRRVSYFVRVMVLPLAILVFAAFTFKAKTNHSLYHGKKITVVIDAGHGGEKDPGARSTDGILEKDLALAFAKKVKELNNNDDIDIILTRDEDIYMTPMQKADFAKSKNADLFISFHVDGEPSTKNPKRSGMSFWVSKNQYTNSTQSKILASAIFNEFSKNYGLNIIGGINQRQSGVWILQANTCPAVIIETGFISNNNDVAYLKTDAAKETIAKNVLAAIEKYASSQSQFNTAQNNISLTDTTPHSIFINTKFADTIYTKSDDFKNKALVIIDSKEIGNVGNKYIEEGSAKYSTITIYNPAEAKKIYGVKGKYGAIKLTQKDAILATAKSIYFDDKTNTIKLIGPDISLKGDLSNALIYLENKIISADILKTINPEKISSVTVLQGDKLNDITDAKGKKSVIYISLKADDLPEVEIKSSLKKAVPFIDLDTKLSNNSTLYIGIDNPIEFVSSIDKKDLYWQISQGSLEFKNEDLYAKVSTVGKVMITISKRDGTMVPRSFQFNVSRVPDPDDPNFPRTIPIVSLDKPIIKWGINGGGRIEKNYFKAQKELTLTPGFTLLSATLYFQGAGFDKTIVSVTLNSASLSAAEKYIDKCEDGSQIVFDNVNVRDNNGNNITLSKPPVFILGFDNQNNNSKTDAAKASEAAITKAIQDERAKQNTDDNKIFTKAETSPQFIGGQQGWRDFLRKNLNAGIPVDSGASAGKYIVIVKFIVHTDGSVSDITCEKDPGFGTCEEVKRIIKESSKKWEPAVQNGRKVNAYHRQPVTFVVED